MGAILTKVRQKKIGDQVMVITGATSGIGLATAQLAAQRGARLVLVARNSVALDALREDFEKKGHEVVGVTADVSDVSQVARITDVAKRRFGGIDTWINNAGVTLFGEVLKTEIEDERRLFDVNYWGVVYGSREAICHFRGRGGTIINVGSVASERAVPLQGAYCASKHAVKAFTDALRMELEKDNLGISVSFIMPASIATPLPEHAKSIVGKALRLIPPLYDPRVVAEAILACTEKKIRGIGVGGFGFVPMVMMEKLAPRLMDRLMEKTMFALQKSEEPARGELETNLHHPPRLEGRVFGRRHGRIVKSSLFTSVNLSPVKSIAIALGMIALSGTMLSTFRRS